MHSQLLFHLSSVKPGQNKDWQIRNSSFSWVGLHCNYSWYNIYSVHFIILYLGHPSFLCPFHRDNSSCFQQITQCQTIFLANLGYLSSLAYAAVRFMQLKKKQQKIKFLDYIFNPQVPLILILCKTVQINSKSNFIFTCPTGISRRLLSFCIRSIVQMRSFCCKGMVGCSPLVDFIILEP